MDANIELHAQVWAILNDAPELADIPSQVLFHLATKVIGGLGAAGYRLERGAAAPDRRDHPRPSVPGDITKS